MRLVIQIVLVPFWVIGFAAATVVFVAVAVWFAVSAGYTATRKRQQRSGRRALSESSEVFR